MDSGVKHVFQLVLLGLFAVAAVLGVIFLATTPDEKEVGAVPIAQITIWGPPFTAGSMQSLINALKKEHGALSKTKYVEKNPFTMYGDLIEAIAVGKGPDLILLDSSGLLPLKNKIYPISFEVYPLRQYRDTFVEGSELFVLDDGIYALPLVVDPLVLYWNRDLFTNAVVAQVPKEWATFVQIVPRLSVIQDGADLTQSAIAFGEYENVMHAKEILSALFMQTGSELVTVRNGKFIADLRSGRESGTDPLLAMQFYTDFSNPLKVVYSWNKTFTRSREAFAANKVAMYAGPASEVPLLVEINPNLNFDISVWPQSVTGKNRLTYGHFYGMAIVRSSANIAAAYQVAQILTSAGAAAEVTAVTGLPTVRRDMLSAAPEDPFASVIAQSAMISRSWLEPAGHGVIDDIFSRLVNNIVAGNKTIEKALSSVDNELNVLLEEYNK